MPTNVKAQMEGIRRKFAAVIFQWQRSDFTGRHNGTWWAETTVWMPLFSGPRGMAGASHDFNLKVLQRASIYCRERCRMPPFDVRHYCFVSVDWEKRGKVG